MTELTEDKNVYYCPVHRNHVFDKYNLIAGSEMCECEMIND